MLYKYFVFAGMGQVLLYCEKKYPTNTRHQPDVGSMVDHRLRLWPNTDPNHILFAGQLDKARQIIFFVQFK